MSVRKEENKEGKRKVGRRKGEFLWCYHKEYIFYNKEFPKVKLSDHNDILEKINNGDGPVICQPSKSGSGRGVKSGIRLADISWYSVFWSVIHCSRLTMTRNGFLYCPSDSIWLKADAASYPHISSFSFFLVMELILTGGSHVYK